MGGQGSGRTSMFTMEQWKLIAPHLVNRVNRRKISKLLNFNYDTFQWFLKSIGISWIYDNPNRTRGVGHYLTPDGRVIDEETVESLIPIIQECQQRTPKEVPVVSSVTERDTGIVMVDIAPQLNVTEEMTMADDVVTTKDLKLAESGFERKIETLQRTQEDRMREMKEQFPTKDSIDKSLGLITEQFGVFQKKMEETIQQGLANATNGSQQLKGQFDQITGTLQHLPTKEELEKTTQTLKSEVDGTLQGFQGKLEQVPTKEEMVTLQTKVKEEVTALLNGLPQTPEFQKAVVGCVEGKCDDVLGILESRKQELLAQQVAEAQAQGQEVEGMEPKKGKPHKLASDYFDCPECGQYFQEAAEKHSGIRSAVLKQLTQEELTTLVTNLQAQGLKVDIKPIQQASVSGW